MHRDLRTVARVRVVADALMEVSADELANQAKVEARFARRRCGRVVRQRGATQAA